MEEQRDMMSSSEQMPEEAVSPCGGDAAETVVNGDNAVQRDAAEQPVEETLEPKEKQDVAVSSEAGITEREEEEAQEDE